jgi:hypothetical protein
MQQPNHLRYLNEMVAVAKKPPEEWNALLAPHRTGLRGQPMVIQMLAPAIDKMGQASQRNHAVLRSAIVALAAERFRQQHGRWPETLDELVRSKLLSAVPTDSYNGAPITLARPAAALVVYCVGPDGADNGGKIDRQNPTKPGTDLGFQLWDAPARRAPALPPKPSGPDDGRGPRP